MNIHNKDIMLAHKSKLTISFEYCISYHCLFCSLIKMVYTALSTSCPKAIFQNLEADIIKKISWSCVLPCFGKLSCSDITCSTYDITTVLSDEPTPLFGVVCATCKVK